MVIGHDWGAAVTYLIAGKRPDLCKSLTTICIPYNVSLLRTLLRCPSYIINAWYIIFFQIWWIAEYFIRRNDFRFIDMLYRTWCPPWRDYDDRLTSVKKTLREPGALRGALGYYRNSLFGLNSAPLDGSIGLTVLISVNRSCTVSSLSATSARPDQRSTNCLGILKR